MVALENQIVVTTNVQPRDTALQTVHIIKCCSKNVDSGRLLTPETKKIELCAKPIVATKRIYSTL